jgi:hypothetical protein
MADKPKPPTGYDSWIDFAVERAMLDCNIDTAWSHCGTDEKRSEYRLHATAAARAELAKLKLDREAMNALRSGNVARVDNYRGNFTAKGLGTQSISSDVVAAIMGAVECATVAEAAKVGRGTVE